MHSHRPPRRGHERRPAPAASPGDRYRRQRTSSSQQPRPGRPRVAGGRPSPPDHRSHRRHRNHVVDHGRQAGVDASARSAARPVLKPSVPLAGTAFGGTPAAGALFITILPRPFVLPSGCPGAFGVLVTAARAASARSERTYGQVTPQLPTGPRSARQHRRYPAAASWRGGPAVRGRLGWPDRGDVHEQVVGHQGDGHTIRTATASAGWPRYRMYRSGSHRTSVTRMARRQNSHRGAEVTRVTIGHAALAMITPITVSLA